MLMAVQKEVVYIFNVRSYWQQGLGVILTLKRHDLIMKQGSTQSQISMTHLFLVMGNELILWKNRR